MPGVPLHRDPLGLRLDLAHGHAFTFRLEAGSRDNWTLAHWNGEHQAGAFTFPEIAVSAAFVALAAIGDHIHTEGLPR